MIVYVLFVHKKICFKEKSLYYFNKKLEILKNKKKTFLEGFLCGFFLVFLGDFFLLPTLIPTISQLVIDIRMRPSKFTAKTFGIFNGKNTSGVLLAPRQDSTVSAYLVLLASRIRINSFFCTNFFQNYFFTSKQLHTCMYRYRNLFKFFNKILQNLILRKLMIYCQNIC
jgi:hypothetical protein